MGLRGPDKPQNIMKLSQFLAEECYNGEDIMSKTLILTMGGTIDAEPWGTRPVDVTPKPTSSIADALDKMGYAGKYEIVHLCKKDSKYVTPHDLQDAAYHILCRPDIDHIIITHGTDTMPQHARYLHQKLLEWNIEPGKTIVFTGSMKPLANGPETDGYRNLQVAMDNIARYPEGVQIVMHGHRIGIDGARKDIEGERIRRVRGADDLTPLTPW